MTVSNQTSNETFDGNGVTTIWSLPFRFFSNSDIQAYRIDPVADTSTLLVLGTDYTLTGAGLPEQFGTAPGKITTTVPMPGGKQLYVERVMAIEQLTDIVNQGRFFPETHEDVFDRLTMFIQQLFASVGNSLKKARDGLSWDFLGLRGSNAGDPVYPQDVTTRSWVERIVSGVVGGYGFFMQPIINAIARTFQSKMEETVSFKDFGVKSDYYTDDTAAVRLALNSVPKGTVLWLEGPTRLTDGVIIPDGVIVNGPVAPIMGTFPTHQDDKRFLRPGYKHLIPGACFILSGTGAAIGTTVREAPYDSFRYGVRIVGNNSAAQMNGVGIIMDMDVLDAAGNVTTVAQDNRSNYDVGLFVDDSCLGRFDKVVVFGYWKVAGVLNYGDDPDQNVFSNGSSSGERGFVNLPTGAAGFSGTNLDNWNLYANDHHKRDLVAAQWGTCALSFISKNGYNVDGLYVHGGRINTYCDTPLILNDCSNAWFFGTVMELPDAASPGATTSKFIGNAAVDKVGFVGCRWTDNPIIGADRLSGQISGTIIIVGEQKGFTPESGFTQIRGGKVIRMQMNASGPSIQLANVADSSSAGVILRIDASENLQINMAGVTRATLSPTGVLKPTVAMGDKTRYERSSVVVAGGAITATRSYHSVTSGTGAGVNLDTINGGTQGDVLWLQAGLTAEPITLKTTGGNIRIGSDLIVTGFTRAQLLFDGSFWVKAS